MRSSPPPSAPYPAADIANVRQGGGVAQPSAKLSVTKASGVAEPFSERKFARSLRRSGAKPAEIKRTIEAIRGNLHPGITTRELYRIAFAELRRQSRPAAARYSLKNAIFQLGPSGFPFERYVGALFAARGHQVSFNAVLPGRCITHEIDVVAVQGGRRTFVECKYHNEPGIASDVKVALYLHARALDLRARDPGTEFCVVTNTRFTTEALRYAACVGLTIIGWDHPVRDGIRDWVAKSRLHPVTCLTTLSRGQKAELLRKGIVLSQDLLRDPVAMRLTGASEFQRARIRDEVASL